MLHLPTSILRPSLPLLLAVSLPHSSPAGLVAWWKLDEAAGKTMAFDASGLASPMPGTAVNGPAFQPSAGKFGGTLYLDGTNDYLEIPDRSELEFPLAQSFSISLWFKSDGDEASLPAEYGNGQNQGLLTKGYPGTTYSNNYYQLQLTVPATGATTQAYFSIDSRISTTVNIPFRQPGATKLPDPINNAWHQLAVVMNRTSGVFTMYIDGAVYHTFTTTNATNGGQWDMGTNTATLIMGNHQNRYCKGWFDDVGIWNHALSAADMTAIFNNGIKALADTDNDGLTDQWELRFFAALTDQSETGDPDTDGATNLQEFLAGVSPTTADSDSDGLSDGAEINTHGTNPLLADTDGDTLSDGEEINTRLTNPLLRDTDGDTWDDNLEIAGGSDPLNPASVPPPAAYNVHINEFVAENLPRPNDPTAPIDMDGEYPDWIEIKNNEPTSVNIKGYQLTDDPANLSKYVLPGVTIPANGYVIVYASGKNRRVNAVQPHTNFTLGNSDQLILSRPVSGGGTQVVSQIGTTLAAYASQRQTVSYGSPDNTAAAGFGYLTTPTPGSANNGASLVSEWVKDTNFSVDRGLYSAPFTVAITCATPGATIAWTTNGSAPSPTNGTQVPAADPLSLPSATVNISSTTLLRARAWKTGMGSSGVDTQSYIFPAEVLTQNAPTASMNLAPADTLAWGTAGNDLSNLTAFPGLTFWGVNQQIVTDTDPANKFVENDLKTIPTLSLVANWKDLFGPNDAGQTNGGIYPPATGIGAEGIDRVASMELINPDGSASTPNISKGFQTDGNIHIFGGTSQIRWKSYKLSFRFQCNEEVNYRTYGDSAMNKFRNFTLDATMNNTWMHPADANQRNRSSFVRDFVMADLQNNMGQRGFHTRPTHLYINGLYWGIYFLHEKPDHHFCSAYYGGDTDNWDVFKHSTHPNFTESDPHVNTWPVDPALPVTKPTVANPGGNSTCVSNFEALLDLLGTGNVGANPPVLPDLAISTNYNAVGAMLDMDAFIDYMLVNYLAGNQDWADKNLYAARNRNGGKWRFFSWDAEHTFRSGTENFIVNAGNEATPRRNGNPKQIHGRLLTSTEYRLRFADRIRRHMFNSGALSVEGMAAAFNKRLDEIDGPVRAESARWGHIRAASNGNVAYKRSNWLAERNRITVLESGGVSLIQNRWNLYMAPTTGQFRLVGNGPLYPATEAPTLSQHGGNVPANYGLTLTNPNASGAIWFTTDGSDPRLPGGGTGGTAQSGSAATLMASATVKARVLNGTEWSALTEAYFSVDTVAASAANLVISEFCYNPANPSSVEITAGFENSNDFEYVELLNIGDKPVRLADLSFTSGISFDFANASILELTPGARCIAVENAAAFAFRYGAGRPIAGEFSLDTGLSNGGETITLTRNASTTPVTIQSFAYNDKAPWPTAADGEGFSLVLVDPTSGPNHNLPESWRSSFSNDGGTPGQPESTNYATWKSANSISTDHLDTDKDGLANIVEYLFGTNPNQPGSQIDLAAEISPATTGLITEDYLTVTFTHPGANLDVIYRPQFSTDLQIWDGAMVRIHYTNNPDGTVTESWRSTTPFAGDVRRYVRLSVKP